MQRLRQWGFSDTSRSWLVFIISIYGNKEDVLYDTVREGSQRKEKGGRERQESRVAEALLGGQVKNSKL